MKDSLKKRFAKDMNLHIPVYEEPYWSFFISLYEKEFWAESVWNDFMAGIKEEYGDDVQKFFQDYAGVRDQLIKNIKDHPAYKEFAEGDTTQWDIGNLNLRSDSIYNHEFAGGDYVSVDLKKANIQAMIKCGIITGEGYLDNIYQDWLMRAIGSERKLLAWYIPMSKYIRQAVFGNCNPKRQTKIERFLVWKAAEIVREGLSSLGLEPQIVQLGNDEAVFRITIAPDVTLTKTLFSSISDSIIETEGTVVRICPFHLIEHNFESGEKIIRTYEKKPLLEDGKRVLKSIPKPYYAQVYEALEGITPPENDYDLMFTTENDDLARFINRIKLVAND